MKKIVLAIVLFGLSTSAFANFNAGSGTNSAPAITTVAQAKTAADDSYVTLEGKIEKQIRHEHYIFRDATGTINVEIDDEEWRGLTVTPQNVIRIVAEADKDWNNTTDLDVKSIEMVK